MMAEDTMASHFFSYKHGKALCWDSSCVYTFASTLVNEGAVRAGSAANAAETVKRTKYLSLTDRYEYKTILYMVIKYFTTTQRKENFGVYSKNTSNNYSSIRLSIR